MPLIMHEVSLDKMNLVILNTKLKLEEVDSKVSDI